MHRLGVGQHVQADQPRPVGGAQPAQLAAAGDQHQAARAGRQQRPHLPLIAGVIGHDQHPLLRQQAAVQATLGLGAAWNAFGRHAEGVQEPPDGRLRGNRGAGGVEAAQVHIQLPVTEPSGDLVRPVQRQRGLADM